MPRGPNRYPVDMPKRLTPLRAAPLLCAASLLALAPACISTEAWLEADAAASPPADVQAVSLRGEPLRPPPMSPEAAAERRAQLAEARAASYEHPAEALLWIGRRLAYLGRFREAMDVFRGGHAAYPRDARFLRHLGHRQITVREFAAAEATLERAAELVRGRPDQVEPDGQPNARGIPLSTLQSNIHYHLGLARFLQADYEGALAAYDDYRRVSSDHDGEVAIDHWTWMALRRLGRDAEAAAAVADVRADWDIVENAGYHRLCLLYRGEVSADDLMGELRGSGEDPAVDDATLGFGLGNYLWVHGRRAEARAVWERVLAGDAWHAFGYIAAEADLARRP